VAAVLPHLLEWDHIGREPAGDHLDALLGIALPLVSQEEMHQEAPFWSIWKQEGQVRYPLQARWTYMDAAFFQ
jgi:hypothetical protein